MVSTSGKLSASEKQLVEALVAKKGEAGAARALFVARVTVLRVLCGRVYRASTAECIRSRLRALARERAA
jgi:hypothetical protein